MVDMTDVKDHARENAILAVETAADTIVGLMKTEAPVASGALVDSIGHSEVTVRGDAVSVEFFATAPHADFQDRGTSGPYIITVGAGARVLHFESGGEEFFRQEVTHYGVPAIGYFSDNMERAEEIVQQFMEVLQ